MERDATTTRLGTLTGAAASHRAARWVALVVALLAGLAMLASGCSADDDAGTATDEGARTSAERDLATGGGAEDGAAGDDGGVVAAPAEETASEPSEGEDAAEEQPTEPIGTGGADVGALQPTDIGRDIVFTAQISVAVDDVVIAGRQALNAVESLGGLLFGQETSVADTPRTVLTFKVPPERFQQAVALLGDVGVLTDQVISADDVTDRVVDLESRIITAEASVERLRGFLAGATELETVASLERELLARETDLELLRGRLRTLRGQVDLATITVVLTQARPMPELSVELRYLPGHEEGRTSCGGDDELRVDEGDDVTVCVELVNSGDTSLADIDVRHRDLDLEVGDFTLVSGDLAAPLRPGQALVFAAQVEAGPSVFGAAVATAVAVDPEGADLGVGSVEGSDSARLEVDQSVTLPGVGDAFSAGWNALTIVGGVVLLGVAVAIPFLWLPVVVWFTWRWMRRHSRRPAQAPAASTDGPA